MLLFSKHPRYPQKRKFSRLSFLLTCLVLIFITVIAMRTLDSLTVNNRSGSAHTLATLSPREEYPQGPLPARLVFDKLLLEKSGRRLTAYAEGKAVRVYLVALGRQPQGHKEYEGDLRTPEGLYSIDGKNPNSAYYKNLGISYPNAADREHAAKLGKSPGGNIKIHGLAPDFAVIGPAHRLTDWTYGCIAVTNPEVDELFSRTPVGTPLEIVP